MVSVGIDVNGDGEITGKERATVQSIWPCIDEPSTRLDVEDSTIHDEGYSFAPGGTLDAYGDEDGDALAMKVVELDGAKQATLNEPQEAWVVIPFHRHGIKKITGLTATLDSTAVPGILTNSTDDPIAANNRQDYSFNPHQDCDTAILDYDGMQTAPGDRLGQTNVPYCFYYDDTPQHDGSHGALVLKVYCKDFGGNCEVTFSGTVELWGVTGWSLSLENVKVELPFTGCDAPLEPMPFWDWMDKELIADNCTWLQVYGNTQEERRRDLVTIQDGQAGEAWTDLEPRRPGNPYAGFPEHLSEGDSLTLLQEYRGFAVSGGGFDANGQPTIPSELLYTWNARVRLSPAIKELLVQVDVMKGIKDFGWGYAARVMDDVSKKFSHKTDGAGIRLYWYLHEREATPSQVFSSVGQRNNWGTSHRNKDVMPEYVHLSFAKGKTYGVGAASGGDASGKGAFVYVESALRIADEPGNQYDHHLFLVRCASHEITHLLLNEIGAYPFSLAEHITGATDFVYLMYQYIEDINATTVIFSNKTRSRLNLRSKETVERFAITD